MRTTRLSKRVTAPLLRCLRYVVGKIVARPVRWQLNRFEAATHEPQLVQEALLRRILTQNAATIFGREHGFATIRTVADFRRQLPIADYEVFEPYLARMRKGEP